MHKNSSVNSKVLLLAVAVFSATMNVTARPQKGQAATARAAQEKVEAPDHNAVDSARGSFDRFLDSHPEIARDLIRGGAQQAREEKYLNEHPELRVFLDDHPLVKQDPRAFLSRDPWRVQRDRPPLEQFMNYAAPIFIFVAIFTGLLWVLRVILENRRWSKASQIQAEVHTKLLERLGSSQELVAYMQTEAGKHFLEAAPIPAAIEPSWVRRHPYPLGRILWSVQAGLILALVGMGFNFESQRAELFRIFGTLALTLGIGFILSAVVSYVLSKRLGLLGDGRSQSAGSPQ